PDRERALKRRKRAEFPSERNENAIDRFVDLPMSSERTLDERPRFDEPAMNDESPLERLARAAHLANSVGQARVENGEAIELGGNRTEEIFELDSFRVSFFRPEARPEFEES